jgi:putative transposase
VAFINVYRSRWGVEPICRVLHFAPSTYYAAVIRPASRRAVDDAVFKVEIARVHRDNFDAYGPNKVWRQLRREEFALGRDRVVRLMRELGLRGIVRGAKKRTTIPGPLSDRPLDLVQRVFAAPAPNRLWVADLT